VNTSEVYGVLKRIADALEHAKRIADALEHLNRLVQQAQDQHKKDQL